MPDAPQPASATIPSDPLRPVPPLPPGVPAPPMARLHLWQIQWVRDLLIIAAAIGVVYLGYQIRIVTVPILIALALAYLFEPLVRLLVSRRYCSRRIAAVGIIVVSIVVLVVPLLLGAGFALVQGARAASELAQNISRVQQSAAAPEDAQLKAGVPPGAWMSIRDFLAERPARLERQQESARRSGQSTDDEFVGPPSPEQVERDRDPHQYRPGQPPPSSGPVERAQTPVSSPPASHGVLSYFGGREEMRELGYRIADWISTHAGELSAGLGRRVASGGADAARAAFATASTIGSIILQGVLTTIFFYFFCTGWDRVVAFWQSFIPIANRSRAADILGKMDRAIAGFVRGRITICAVEACFFTLMYFLAGVPAPLVLGPIVGMIFIVPFMQVLGVPVAMALMWLGNVEGPVFAPHLFASSGGLWWILIAPPVIHFTANVFDDYFLTPTIQGKHTDLAIPTIVFSSIAGGALAGVYGLLLAIPVAACVRILLKEVVFPRINLWVRGEAKDVLPIGRE